MQMSFFDFEEFNELKAEAKKKEAPRKKKEEKQKEMGIISNLITDMTLRGADEKEIARAVKHSMVVIDAEKHKLDYKRSERENGIQELKTAMNTLVVHLHCCLAVSRPYMSPNVRVVPALIRKLVSLSTKSLAAGILIRRKASLLMHSRR